MHTSIERPLRLEGRPARAPSIRPAHERWARRPRAVSTAAAAAHRALEFPQRGSGLLWARSTGLKLWPGALLLARAVEASDQDPQLLAALHPSLAAAQRRGHHHDTPPWRWSDKLVLELGCGLGLVACTAAQLGARVVATDGDADLLRVGGPPARARGADALRATSSGAQRACVRGGASMRAVSESPRFVTLPCCCRSQQRTSPITQ